MTKPSIIAEPSVTRIEACHRDAVLVAGSLVVTRDPARLLPAADSRTLMVKAGDRPV